MKVISTDLETTGLDEDYCQIIELAAVIEDISNPQPLDKLPTFHCYIVHDIYKGEAAALAMHAKIFKRIAERTPGYNYYAPYEAAYAFQQWLLQNIPNQLKYTMVGKNFASFDLPFLKAEPNFKPLTKFFHHRVMDLGSMFVSPVLDQVLPSTAECLKRAGMDTNISHEAKDDALQVIQLIRKWKEIKGF